MARKKKAEVQEQLPVPAVQKVKAPEPEVVVSICNIHGRFICNPVEQPICPCCTCQYIDVKIERDYDEDYDARDYRYIVIPEVENPMLAGTESDETIVVPVHDGQAFIEVEYHNGSMTCPCCCCLRDVQLMERYGINVEKELAFERNIDILMDGLYKKG